MSRQASLQAASMVWGFMVGWAGLVGFGDRATLAWCQGSGGAIVPVVQVSHIPGLVAYSQPASNIALANFKMSSSFPEYSITDTLQQGCSETILRISLSLIIVLPQFGLILLGRVISL